MRAPDSGCGLKRVQTFSLLAQGRVVQAFVWQVPWLPRLWQQAFGCCGLIACKSQEAQCRGRNWGLVRGGPRACNVVCGLIGPGSLHPAPIRNGPRTAISSTPADGYRGPLPCSSLATHGVVRIELWSATTAGHKASSPMHAWTAIGWMCLATQHVCAAMGSVFELVARCARCWLCYSRRLVGRPAARQQHQQLGAANPLEDGGQHQSLVLPGVCAPRLARRGDRESCFPSSCCITRAAPCRNERHAIDLRRVARCGVSRLCRGQDEWKANSSFGARQSAHQMHDLPATTAIVFSISGHRFYIAWPCYTRRNDCACCWDHASTSSRRPFMWQPCLLEH